MQKINKICQNARLMTNIRCYSYKPIKRPTLNAPLKSKFAGQTNAEKQLSLSKTLAARISMGGPISVADYMKQVLTNPNSGYYMSKDVFGEKGDFITSPEISQIFGELVAVWCITEWEKCGSQDHLQLVEFGPGRGTLSQDILRVFANFNLSDKISLHLVEVSPFLSEVQARRLCCQHSDTKKEDEGTVPYFRKGETVSGIQVYWYRSIEQVPKAFSVYLAHEFFDALPIHKFHCKDKKWKEILVDIDGEGKEDTFRFIESNTTTPILGVFLTRPWLNREALSSHVEYSVEIEQTIDAIADRIDEYGGFSLIMDYGHEGEKGDTFRAFKKHALHNPLHDPGTADLTADVDFSQIKAIATQNDRVLTLGPVQQREFLNRMGGETHLKKLIENAKSTEDTELLNSGYNMLTDPSKMGERFKFFAMFPKVLEEHLKKFPVNGFHEQRQK